MPGYGRDWGTDVTGVVGAGLAASKSGVPGVGGAVPFSQAVMDTRASATALTVLKVFIEPPANISGNLPA